ncbi:MAG: heavy-metal-associated domain-containing protein, partial [Bacteroidales bacterium]|nr:heavy-metal-associated domain-containing protein [Bacteroidales bacterium]
MKTILKAGLTGFVLVFFFVLQGIGQEIKKEDTLTVQTSAVCGMCKERIEQGLAFEKGVKKASLDEETKKVKVIFYPAKTNPDIIRNAISKLGYDADNVAADPK